MEILSKSTEDTKKLARSLIKTLKPGDVLALHGDLGSGKTTFTSFLVHLLGFESRVQSPTYVIARRYERRNGSEGSEDDLIKIVNHIDLYRLRSVEEVEDIGFVETITEPGSITVIEWPGIAEDMLPANTKHIYFEYIDENIRRIKTDENIH